MRARFSFPGPRKLESETMGQVFWNPVSGSPELPNKAETMPVDAFLLPFWTRGQYPPPPPSDEKSFN